jgi:hypothetical protein
LKASYTLQTVNGQVQIVDNDAVADGNDGTDTLAGIEIVQFKDQQMGIVSPIVLDLDGAGIQTRSAVQSRAAFDMNGDGRADDTSWIGSSEAFLFLDRDGNGTMSGVSELSFTDDLPGAKTDLEGLQAFDSNSDGKISSADNRFTEFRVWRDRNGDGTVDKGEVQSLTDIGLQSISLSGTAISSSVHPGDVAVINTGTWTRIDGTSMQLADAVLTYFAGDKKHRPAVPMMRSLIADGERPSMFGKSSHIPVMRPIDVTLRGVSKKLDGPAVMRSIDRGSSDTALSDNAEARPSEGSTLRNVLDELRQENLLGARGGSATWTNLMRVLEETERGAGTHLSVPGPARHTQLYNVIPATAQGLGIESRLQTIAQDVAAFGGTTAAKLDDLHRWENDSPTLFAA